MLRRVGNQGSLLAELRRITKPGSALALGDGHQPREERRRAIHDAGVWMVEEENCEYLRCRPV
jgi:hypothetical protein